MATSSTDKDIKYLNPTFFIPDGVTDVKYEDTTGDADSNLESTTDSTEVGPDVYITDAGDILDDQSVILDFPASVTIVSQTIRRAAGGQQVVDVVIEVSDVQGAQNYQIQKAII